MPASTTKYGVPYAIGTDALASVDERMQAMAERLDLLLGETGTGSITPVTANTTVSLRVDYGRSYAALPAVPRVFVGLNAGVNSTDTIHLWPSGEDATGFTMNARSQSVGTARPFRWECRAR